MIGAAKPSVTGPFHTTLGVSGSAVGRTDPAGMAPSNPGPRWDGQSAAIRAVRQEDSTRARTSMDMGVHAVVAARMSTSLPWERSRPSDTRKNGKGYAAGDPALAP